MTASPHSLQKYLFLMAEREHELVSSTLHLGTVWSQGSEQAARLHPSSPLPQAKEVPPLRGKALWDKADGSYQKHFWIVVILTNGERKCLLCNFRLHSFSVNMK